MKTARKKRFGTQSTKLTIKTRKGETLHSDESSEPIEAPTANSDSITMVRFAISAKLSLEYNSVMVEVGLEMPMRVEPGDMRGALAAIKQVERVCEKRLESKSAEMRTLLRDLAGG